MNHDVFHNNSDTLPTLLLQLSPFTPIKGQLSSCSIVNIAASNQAIKSCERVQETLDSIYTSTVPPTTPPQFPTKWPTLAPTSSE
ncbi:hypothetical protein FOVSG1_009816 [Fusarium oxysporum f. sp. vasinfectum]